MTGPEHYAEAERLIAMGRKDFATGVTSTGLIVTPPPEVTALAQAHATLALAAATAFPYGGEWAEVTK